MQLARRWLDPDRWPFRWLMLLLASLMLFGAYFGYDSVGDIAVTLSTCALRCAFSIRTPQLAARTN